MNTRIAFAPVLAAGLCLAAAAPATAAEQTWRVQNGTVTLSLFRQVITDSGLQLVDLRQTATPRGDMEEAVGFAVDKSSNLEFAVLGGRYQHWTGGAVRVSGGFTLKSKRGTLSAQDFAVVFRETGDSANFALVTGKDVSAPTELDMSHVKVIFDRAEKTLLFGYSDLIVNDRGARKLGRPELAGQVIGMVTVGAQSAFVGGDPKDPDAVVQQGDGGGQNGDVMLFNLLDCESYGRIGTFPNGTSGLGIGTTSCNRATTTGNNVNWYIQMDERHPVIAQNLYRLQTIAGAGTRFEQIGIGWVKHGFLSTNSNGCGQCQDPGGGHLLGLNCSDTYGSSLNASRSWLGPRDEVNVFTGRWECTGSYFSNYQPDCVERFTTGGLNPVDHRLQVKDQDLLAPNSQFFYEAYYVSENDEDRYNNAAWRPCSAVWSAGTTEFNFNPLAAQTQGVRIDDWGQIQPAPRAMPNVEGDILVGVEVTDLGGGQHHYEYAVYNHTSNREGRTFSVPLPAGANVTNIGFHDVDFDATNDWRSTIENGTITWSTDAYVEDPEANSLKWFTVYNFRFDANVAPADGHVGIGLFRPGTLQTLGAVSRVPQSRQVPPTSMSIAPGFTQTGGLYDLYFSDENRLGARPGIVSSAGEAPIRVNLEGTSPTLSPGSMTFRLESQASSTGLGKSVEAFNFSTNQWVVVSAVTQCTTDDSVINANIANPAQYVQAGTRTVKVRVNFKPTAPILAFPYTARVDMAVWIIQ